MAIVLLSLAEWYRQSPYYSDVAGSFPALLKQPRGESPLRNGIFKLEQSSDIQTSLTDK